MAIIQQLAFEFNPLPCPPSASLATQQCQKCGRLYPIKKYHKPASIRSYCPNCRNTYSPKESGPLWSDKMVSKSCAICGKSYFVKIKYIEKGHGETCSVPCGRIFGARKKSEKAQDKRVIKYCIICNVEIRIKPSRVGKEGTYCSRACMAHDYRTRMASKANPHYIDGQGTKQIDVCRRRRERLRVNGGTHTNEQWLAVCVAAKNLCLRCGKEGNLSKDHIVPISKGGGGDISNIQPLCRRCNSQKHAKEQDYRA